MSAIPSLSLLLLGYSNISHFIEAFKKRYEITLGEI